jgi:hypothetical protein
MKDRDTGLILAIFLGAFGVQYFYIGKILKGLLFLFTFGFCGIGWIISIFTIRGQVDVYNTLHGCTTSAQVAAASASSTIVNNIVVQQAPTSEEKEN